MAFTLSLGMIVSSSVFLLSLTFCCLHSIHCTCYVPLDDHQSTYFLYLPLNTYLWFSWSHPVHWPLSLPARLAHLNIDTYLSWVVTLVMRFEPVTTPTAVQRIHHLCRWAFCFIFVSWSVLTVTWSSGLLHRCPAHYQLIFSFIVLPWSVLSLTWASSLSLCNPAHTFFFSLSSLPWTSDLFHQSPAHYQVC